MHQLIKGIEILAPTDFAKKDVSKPSQGILPHVHSVEVEFFRAFS